MFIDVDSLILSSLRQERNVRQSRHRTPNGVPTPQDSSAINMSLLRSEEWLARGI